MYHSYFGLKEQVFSIAVDPHYLYMSSQHREALAHLLYGVSSGGFVLLTGEVGTGKTTIVRCLLEQLPEGTDLAIVLNPVASAPELLAGICDELGISCEPGETSIKVLTDKLYAYLLARHTQGRNTVLLIDEAQLLRVSTLEQIRLLTNLETNTRKLLQIILVGQPELSQLLGKPSLRQLSQRITARYHLRALTLEETHAYISHRLHVAGMKPSEQPFPAEIISRIHGVSRGIPRLINILCDRMLLGAYSQDKTQIDLSICRQARLEVLGEEASSNAARQAPMVTRPWLQVSGWGLVVILAVALVWQLVSVPAMSPATAEMTITKTPVVLPSAATPKNPLMPEKSVSQDGNVYPAYAHAREAGALLELFSVLDISSMTGMNPCDKSTNAGYQCETVQLVSWNQLRELDRPAVLQLITPAKREVFATLIGLDDDTATLSVAGVLYDQPIDRLGLRWTGNITYIWHKPEAFIDMVAFGAEGPMVDWIAAQFALLDNQPEPLTKNRFNQALAERIKIFQRNHDLRDDGVFGVRTLMALNEQRGIDKTLQDLNPLLSAER